MSNLEEVKVLEGEYISGSGKGGGGGETPREDPDTLHSNQIIKLLIAYSEGETNSVPTILINNAPSTDYNGTISVQWRPGVPNQTVLTGFSEVESPLENAGTFPVELLHLVDHNYIVPASKGAVRITLYTDRLMRVDGDGNRVGYGMWHKISRRTRILNQSPGNWELVFDHHKKGKTTKPYAWDMRVDAPAGLGPNDSWEVQITRWGDDDSTRGDRYFSRTYIQQIIAIVESARNYPNTALVGITLRDSEYFGGRLPDIKIYGEGIKVDIPSNYDPVTRTYNESTPWDGTFKTSKYYTTNLSWNILECLRHTLKGLGIGSGEIDIGSFYNYAKFCDSLVSNGFGGQEPRYTINAQFIEAQDTAQFLTDLLALGNANFSSNELGQLAIIYDAPNQPITQLVTNANVIDGMFDYATSDIETVYSSCNVTFKDNAKKGDTNTVTHTDSSLVTRYGFKKLDLVLFGCVSKSMALRHARAAIWNSSMERDIITFRVGFYGGNFQVGQLINLMDSDNQSSSACHAVIKSFTSNSPAGKTTAILDRSIILGNENYTVSYILSDGISVHNTSIVQKNGTFSTIQINEVATLFPGTVILFSCASVAVRTVKVVKVAQIEKHIYEITTIGHTEGKYSYIAGIGTISQYDDTSSFIDFDYYGTLAPTNLTVEETFNSNAVSSGTSLAVDWDWDTNFTAKYKARFNLYWSKDDGNTTLVPNLVLSNYELKNVTPGIYKFTVKAINTFNKVESVGITTTYNYRLDAGAGTTPSTLLPPNNVKINGVAGTTFEGKDVSVTFSYNTANDAITIKDKLKDYILEIWDSTGTTKKYSYLVPQLSNRGGTFLFSYEENIALFVVAVRSFQIRIYSRDVLGDLSSPVTVTVSNPVPAVPSWTLTSYIQAVRVRITSAPERDVVEYRIYASETQNFTKDASTLKYSGPDRDIILPATSNVPTYVAISAIDSFGDSGALISTENNTTAFNAEPDNYTYTGFTFKPNDPTTNKITWSAGQVSRNGETPWNITAETTGVEWTTGTLYIYYVPGNTTLSSGTSLVNALAEGGRVIATYRGGTDLVTDYGRAFLSGDMLLAGTVGASQLVTNTAVITTAAQIASAIIDNAHIVNLSGTKIDTNTLVAEKIINNSLIQAVSSYKTTQNILTSSWDQLIQVTLDLSSKVSGTTLMVRMVGSCVGSNLTYRLGFNFHTNVYYWSGSAYVLADTTDAVALSMRTMAFYGTVAVGDYLDARIHFAAIPLVFKYLPGATPGSTYLGENIVVTGSAPKVNFSVAHNVGSTKEFSQINLLVESVYK